MELTSESVLALAPDASSVKAAQALLKPGQWPTLGFNENAVWGECKRQRLQTLPSRSRPVRAGLQVHLPEPEISLKHSLALLLLRVQQEAALYAGRSARLGKGMA